MAEKVEELTVNYEQDGQQLVREIKKKVLTKGAWTTIMYSFQNFDKKTNDFGAEQYTIRRYKKIKGNYSMQSKFNLSSKDQARMVADTLYEWIDEKADEKTE
jgi:hypothetical protein